jgi:hypothetical protein
VLTRQIQSQAVGAGDTALAILRRRRRVFPAIVWRPGHFHPGAAGRLWRGRKGSGRRHGCERQRHGQETREERSANPLRHAVRIKRAKRGFNEELAPPFMKPASGDADPNQT